PAAGRSGGRPWSWSPGRRRPLPALWTRTEPSVERTPTPHRSSTILQLPRALNAMTRVRERLKPGFSDRLATFLAAAELATIEPSQRLVDLFESSLFVLDQAEREFLIIILGSDVRHVQRHVREVPRRVGLVASQRLVGHLVEIATEPGPQHQ